MKYVTNPHFTINEEALGFSLNPTHVLTAAIKANEEVATGRCLVRTQIQNITNVVSDNFQSILSDLTGSVMNQNRNGFPDLMERIALRLSLKETMRYEGHGAELKTSSGTTPPGTGLWPYGVPRVNSLHNLTFVSTKATGKIPVMSIIWDFIDSFPMITAVMCAQLSDDDWGKGKKTRVRKILMSGLRKLAQGWMVVTDDVNYQSVYRKLLGVPELPLFRDCGLATVACSMV